MNDAMSSSWVSRRAGAWRGLGAGLLALLFFLAALYRTDMASGEGIVYAETCELILAKTSQGRQALVGSAWWPPLNTLLRLPFAGLGGIEVLPAASVAVSALFGAGVVWRVVRSYGAAGAGAFGIVAAIALVANPAFAEQSLNGSAATTTAFLVLLACHGLVEWLRARRLRGLIYLGTGSALLLLCALDMAPLVAAALAALVLDLALARLPAGQKAASLVLVLLPIAYAAGLWVLMNWLIMGDGLYFLRGAVAASRWHSELPPEVATPAGAGFSLAHVAAALVCALAAALGALRRSKASVAFGFMGVAVLVAGMAAVRVWPGRGTDGVLFALFPLAAAAGAVCAADGRPRWPVALLAAASLAVTALVFDDESLMARWKTGSVTAGEVAAERLYWRPRIEQWVLQKSRYPRVFVCGYDGFLLVRPPGGKVFIHTLDLDFQRIRDDFRGCSLYVLIRKPDAVAGSDSVHWKFPGIYENGYRSLLFDSQWGDWRLFEWVQAPERPARSGHALGTEARKP